MIETNALQSTLYGVWGAVQVYVIFIFRFHFDCVLAPDSTTKKRKNKQTKNTKCM